MSPHRFRYGAALSVVLLCCLDAGCSDSGGSIAAVDAPAGVITSTTVLPSTLSTAMTMDLAVPVSLRKVATLDAPTAMTAIGTSGSLLIAERAGRIRELVPTTDDGFDVSAEPVLDLRSDVGETESERGLLGLAVDPANTMLIVSFTDGGDNGASVIRRYTVENGKVDPDSGLEVLRLPQPFSNHNGGDVAFGPDGYLYIGFGDGGGQGDPNGNGQNTSTLLGSILRIDVAHEGSAPYVVPSDNPFVGRSDARPEIWLYGVRNPWRFSFDSLTGDLWIGDVGAATWEEVDFLPQTTGGGRGANLGWSVREGRHWTDEAANHELESIDPIVEYSHDDGAAISGGVVVRDPLVPSLAGVYVFSDFAQSTLRAVTIDASGQGSITIVNTGDTRMDQVVGFGTDAKHRVYALSLTGPIYRVEA